MFLGMRQRVMRDQRGDVGKLGGLRLEKFLARGGVEEQVAHGDRRAGGQSGFFDARDFAAIDFEDRPGRLFRGAGFQTQARDGRDRRQGLAAKAESGDGQQVFRVFHLRGGVALEGEHGVVAHHTASVIGDLDQLFAAGFDDDLDAGGAGVEGVFQQFFDYRGGTFHYLAGGDFVGDVFGEDVDAAHVKISGQGSGIRGQSSVSQTCGEKQRRAGLFGELGTANREGHE